MNVNAIIDRYKRQRSRQQLRSSCKGEYAFVGVGGHSTANLYPILDYLHVPLKYICCNTPEKVPLIERKWRGVHATTALCDVLSDKGNQRCVCVCKSIGPFRDSEASPGMWQVVVCREAALPLIQWTDSAHSRRAGWDFPGNNGRYAETSCPSHTLAGWKAPKR